MENIANKDELLYLRIAKSLEHQIKNGVLKMGDKLPSIRAICYEHGVSMSTALRAYYDLESKSLIESRPQSGYYVAYSHKQFPATPSTSNPKNTDVRETEEDIITLVFSELGIKNNILFSLGVPGTELLPLPKLNKAMVQAMRELKGNGTDYEHIQGSLKLRRQVARLSFSWEGKLKEDDIITTTGCINALSYCMMSLVEKGDTIVVESPVFFGILQLARSLGLKVLELPTNATTGIELEALKKAVEKQKVKLCLLISNFNNPLGSCMPNEHKKEVVKLMEKHNIPLIEDDMYGDVYFGNQRPKSCKTYDESGIVLWCSSVSKTLAPGYRVGWVAPGKFKEKVLRNKVYHSISSTTLTQEAIGIFLENGRYENHLRKLRQKLHINYLLYLRVISESFPKDSKVSRPQGGFILWVELNKNIDTMELYKEAIKHKISIAPGRMFTLQKQYTNCIRLSYGLNWNEQINNGLKLIGKLAKILLQKHST